MIVSREAAAQVGWCLPWMRQRRRGCLGGSAIGCLGERQWERNGFYLVRGICWLFLGLFGHFPCAALHLLSLFIHELQFLFIVLALALIPWDKRKRTTRREECTKSIQRLYRMLGLFGTTLIDLNGSQFKYLYKPLLNWFSSSDWTGKQALVLLACLLPHRIVIFTGCGWWLVAGVFPVMRWPESFCQSRLEKIHSIINVTFLGRIFHEEKRIYATWEMPFRQDCSSLCGEPLHLRSIAHKSEKRQR